VLVNMAKQNYVAFISGVSVKFMICLLKKNNDRLKSSILISHFTEYLIFFTPVYEIFGPYNGGLFSIVLL